MKTTKNVTIHDVAREAGLSTFTVSRALGGRTRVAAETRMHVEAVAERMGYRIDSVASLLGRKRAGNNRKERLLIANLHENIFDSPFPAECEALGWDGRAFRVGEFESPEVASRILWQQGVDGIVVSGGGGNAVAHPFWKGVRKFDWERFPVVKITRAVPELRCDLVQHSAFDYMMMALDKTVETGCRRMAVVLLKSRSEIDNMTRLGAVLAFMAEKLPAGVRGEWRMSGRAGDMQHILDAATIRWLKTYRPDAIVAYHWLMLYQLLAAGLSIPEKVSFAAVLGTSEPPADLPAISGCNVSVPLLYRRALNLLGESISRGERGFPLHPSEYVIEPEWIKGETMITRALPQPLRSRIVTAQEAS